MKTNSNLKLECAILKEALIDMVMQFGYRGICKNNKPSIITGGLKSLEHAFNALGWSEPHELPEEGNSCEVFGCMNPIAIGAIWGKYYLWLCQKCSKDLREGKPCPKIKDYALKNEAKS